MKTSTTDIRVLVRGVLRNTIQIGACAQVGDVDPGFETEYCDTISGKARAMAEGLPRRFSTQSRG
jgi:hypothetical protein